MEDVKNYLNRSRVIGEEVDLTGYLVDTNEGLYLFGDHYPEDYNYEYGVKILNKNIIYPILSCVPALGGG